MDISRTDTEIINLALTLLGSAAVQRIDNLDASALQKPAQAVYRNSVAELLEAYPWSFATKRIKLSRLSTPPEFGWEYQFRLPTDLMTVVGVFADEGGAAHSRTHTVDGHSLLANDPDIWLRYVSRDTQPALFSETFVSALSYNIASKLARLAHGDPGDIARLESQFRDKMDLAYKNDTQKQGIAQITPPNDFMDARN